MRAEITAYFLSMRIYFGVLRRIPEPDVAVASKRPRASISVIARSARGGKASVRILQLCVTTIPGGGLSKPG